MKAVGIALLLTALVAYADEPLRAPLELQVVAVHATNEKQGSKEKSFDPALDDVRDALKTLSFDTFRKIKSTSETVKADKTADIKIDDTYTLHVTPVAKDSEGRVRMKVVIDETVEKDGKKETREALNATCAVVPGKHLVLGGLNMPKGQLVLLLSIKE